MIPKTIHYCWFGGAPLPEKERSCIESWHKHCPDYEILKWNESNYNILQNEYIRQAHAAKRWAFVTDYVRLDVIYQHGGIYLDTDVELIKNLDPLLEHDAFAGMENVDGSQFSINSGLGFGAVKQHPVIEEWRNLYQELSFLQADGTPDLLTTPARITSHLEKFGFRQENIIQEVAGMTIYPTEYFCPKQYGDKNITITSNTYSIHHYSETWKLPEEKKAAQKWDSLSRKFGPRMADIICGLLAHYEQGGVSGITKALTRKLFQKTEI